MKKGLFLLIFSLLQFSGIAQHIASKHQFTVNYLGEFYTHAGLSILYNYSLYQKEKSITNAKGKINTRLIKYQSTNRAAFYVHPKNHNSLLVTSGVRLQSIQSSAWLFGVGLQAGYQLKFINEDIYQINNGTIERIRWETQSLFLMGLEAGIGKDFYIKDHKNSFGWYINNTILWSSPFQVTRQLILLFELGLSYNLVTEKK